MPMPLRHPHNSRRTAPLGKIDVEIEVSLFAEASHQRHGQTQRKHLRRVFDSHGTDPIKQQQ